MICSLLIMVAVAKLGNTVAPFRLIRLLRAIRLLRTVRLFPNLAIVVETIVQSAASVVYIGLFGLLFTYMFAIVGVASFGRNDPFYFGDLGRALLTLFRVMSMDSWSMIMCVLAFAWSIRLAYAGRRLPACYGGDSEFLMQVLRNLGLWPV